MRQRAGKADQLLLPGGERRAALAHRFGKAAGQRADEVPNVDLFGRALQPLVGDPAASPGECCPRCPGKQERILQHHAEAPAQLRSDPARARPRRRPGSARAACRRSASSAPMMVVLPAPVWPTMAAVSSGSIDKLDIAQNPLDIWRRSRSSSPVCRPADALPLLRASSSR